MMPKPAVDTIVLPSAVCRKEGRATIRFSTARNPGMSPSAGGSKWPLSGSRTVAASSRPSATPGRPAMTKALRQSAC